VGKLLPANTKKGVSKLLSPTPYPDVNVVVSDFAARIQSNLGSQFLGLYLYGSLALGDFDPHTSDIDFIVVTDSDLSDDFFTVLREMHAEFDSSNSPWSGKVEAAYIPREALRHADPTHKHYPQIEKGTELFRAPLEIGWAFQLYTLRQYGIVVAGQDLRALINPVNVADMRQAASVILGGWLEQSRYDSSWIAWARRRSNQAFVVLTLCRLLYSLETGDIASKPAAARWAQKNLGARWDALIERSLAGQHNEQETPEDDFEDMLALLTYAMERTQRSG
jgi:hypothetical protein